MFQSTTITSKMQLTLPILIARKMGIVSGDKLTVSDEDGRIILTPIKQLVNKLAGSVTVPDKLKNNDMDEIIREAKVRHFKHRKI
jgi:AbrB family looped-hinge helix DNA binding protein